MGRVSGGAWQLGLEDGAMGNMAAWPWGRG